MNLPENLFPYSFDKNYTRPVAYFSMEFAVDQALKTYSGGLGFLAGSHMRSAYELKQNMVGIGMLWKYGYYDQQRSVNGLMKVNYVQKNYSFLEDIGITFPVLIHGFEVKVKALLLRPEIFKTAQVFFLTTDLPENDHLAQTITHRLYDTIEKARIAQSIILGVGGAKLLDILQRETEVYHLNEGHALPVIFYLLNKYKSEDEVRRRVVFTTHTPEKAGNEEHSSMLLDEMSFFGNLESELKRPFLEQQSLNYTLTALHLSGRANAVSKLHQRVAQKMWNSFPGICEIISITNAQNQTYWMDRKMEAAFQAGDKKGIAERKLELKKELFKIVADQTGKLFDENKLTLVWARRIAPYKRANLLMRHFERFVELTNNRNYPVQIIWAGKPYPEDYQAIEIFNDILRKTLSFPNCAVLTGYELGLSASLKKGSDVWLNNPRLYHEASGTSGMTAAMNGSINVSIADGWVPEFAEDEINSFLIPTAENSASQDAQDDSEANNLIEILQNKVLPLYYSQPDEWRKVVFNAMTDVSPYFDSNRMASEYYEKLYAVASIESTVKKDSQKVILI